MTRRPPGEAGLTLVEMLVVLAIVGVAAGATVLGIGAATRAPSAESEARRLAATLQRAADDAMVTDRALALGWTERSYRFVGAGDDPAYAEHRLPGGMRLAVAGAAVREGAPLVIGIDGTGVPFVARLSSATDRWRIGYDGLKAVATRLPAG